MKFSYLLAFYLFIISLTGFAQNKRALLIGINNYYIKQNKQIVIDPANTLHGCVNDAKSIKKLIVSKFGFSSSNVKELYDSIATKKNILKGINTLHKQSIRGDVAVIYYSGHGMTFPYGQNAAQTAEVICPSDIFTSVNYINDSSYQYSFIQTSELASLFNKFVEKGVVLTVIFDCCYSNGTVGVKKAVNTKTMVNGIPKLFAYEFWEEETSMATTIPPPIIRAGLIRIGAYDQTQTSLCGEQIIDDALKNWLSKNGYAEEDKKCKEGVRWTNNYDSTKWQTICGAAGSTTVLFTANDTCGRNDTTSATFSIVDTTRPEIILPARDTLLECCNPANMEALTAWLKNNGNALATDGCSATTWTNNFEKFKTDFDTSGTALITFTASDACGNKNTTSATFTIEDSKDPIEYRLSAQETKAIIELLNGFDEIKHSVAYYGFNNKAWLRQPLMYRLVIMDTLKTKIKQKTRYDLTGNLDSIQGTQLMVTLLKNIDSLIFILSAIPYKEEYFLFEKNAPASITQKYIDIAANERAIDFKEFNTLKNISGNKDFTKGFPYKEFDFNPPSQMKNSKFLFIAATNDKQKAIEKPDETGTRHGVFTKALVDILQSNPKNISSTVVFDSILRQFQNKKIAQTPTMRMAVSRQQQNLFGVIIKKNQQQNIRH